MIQVYNDFQANRQIIWADRFSGESLFASFDALSDRPLVVDHQIWNYESEQEVGLAGIQGF